MGNTNCTVAFLQGPGKSEEISFISLLEQAGFTIRGRRADCIYCTGRSRLTVAIGGDVAYCFRCHWTRNARRLARELALPVAPETIEQRRARWRRRAFEEWLDTCYTILIHRLWRLVDKARWASEVLRFYPDCEPAWDFLSVYCDQEREIHAALELLAFEKVPTYLEEPMTREKLVAAFEEVLANGS